MWPGRPLSAWLPVPRTSSPLATCSSAWRQPPETSPTSQLATSDRRNVPRAPAAAGHPGWIPVPVLRTLLPEANPRWSLGQELCVGAGHCSRKGSLSPALRDVRVPMGLQCPLLASWPAGQVGLQLWLLWRAGWPPVFSHRRPEAEVTFVSPLFSRKGHSLLPWEAPGPGRVRFFLLHLQSTYSGLSAGSAAPVDPHDSVQRMRYMPCGGQHYQVPAAHCP